jgi:hypothetical protein
MANDPTNLFPERYPNTQKLTEAEKQVPMNQNLPGTILESEAREHLHRAEPKRTKMARRAKARAKRASDAPQGAIPCGVGEVPDLFGSMSDEPDLFGSMADETENQIRAELCGSLTDETENQIPNHPNRVSAGQCRRAEADRRSAAVAAQRAEWKGGGPAWSGWSADPWGE